MEALSSLESILHAGLAAAALVVASWSAWRSMGAPTTAPRGGSSAGSTAGSSAVPRTGELAWTVVAVATLAFVSLAVGLGSTHGI